VSYRDAGSRPLIVPLNHEVTVYTSLKPGLMKIARGAGGSSSKLNVMEHLPADVSPQSPVNPANDVFTIIPAGGAMTPPLVEDITIPIYKKTIKQRIDLRGHKLYVKLQLDHQPLSPALEAAMSDRWTSYGTPWTGRIRTDTLLLDIPALPAAKECIDTRDASYPHRGLDKLQGAQAK